jgi:hypothetical protein
MASSSSAAVPGVKAPIQTYGYGTAAAATPTAASGGATPAEGDEYNEGGGKTKWTDEETAALIDLWKAHYRRSGPLTQAANLVHSDWEREVGRRSRWDATAIRSRMAYMEKLYRQILSPPTGMEMTPSMARWKAAYFEPMHSFLHSEPRLSTVIVDSSAGPLNGKRQLQGAVSEHVP